METNAAPKSELPAGAILGVSGIGSNQSVFRRGQIAFLKQHIGRGRSTQMQLLHFRVYALLLKVPGCDGGLNLGPVVHQRELRIHDLHPDLRAD